MYDATNTAKPHQHGTESPFSALLKFLTTAKETLIYSLS